MLLPSPSIPPPCGASFWYGPGGGGGIFPRLLPTHSQLHCAFSPSILRLRDANLDPKLSLCLGDFCQIFVLQLGFSFSSYLRLDFGLVLHPPKVDPDVLFTALRSRWAFADEHIFLYILGAQVGSKIAPKTVLEGGSNLCLHLLHFFFSKTVNMTSTWPPKVHQKND